MHQLAPIEKVHQSLEINGIITKLTLNVSKGDVKATAKLLSQCHLDPIHRILKSEVKQQDLLMIAVVRGHIGVVNVLCAHGANVNGIDLSNGLRAVHFALICPIPVLMLRALHRLGADMNALNLEGITVLETCFSTESIDEETKYTIVKTLIALGADVNMSSRNENRAPIIYLFTHYYHHRQRMKLRPLHDITRLLLEAGAEINVSASNNELTPLAVAVHFDDVAMVKLLVHWGAHIERNDFAIYQAIFTGATNTVTALIEMGADIDRPVLTIAQQGASSLTFTPVIAAALLGQYNTTTTLCRLGADLNPCQLLSAHDVMLGEIPSHLKQAGSNEANVSAAFQYIHMKLCQAVTRKKRSCHSCGQGQSHSMKLKKCGRCRAAYYCSKACQEAAHRQDKYCCERGDNEEL